MSGYKWSESEKVQNLGGPEDLSGQWQGKAGMQGMGVDGMVEPPSSWK